MCVCVCSCVVHGTQRHAAFYSYTLSFIAPTSSYNESDALPKMCVWLSTLRFFRPSGGEIKKQKRKGSHHSYFLIFFFQ